MARRPRAQAVPPAPRSSHEKAALVIGGTLAGGLVTYLIVRALWPPISSRPISQTAPGPAYDPNSPVMLQAIGPYGLAPAATTTATTSSTTAVPATTASTSASSTATPTTVTSTPTSTTSTTAPIVSGTLTTPPMAQAIPATTSDAPKTVASIATTEQDSTNGS